MDSDDNFLGDNVLQKLVDTMENEKVDLVAFNFIHPCFESHLKTGVYEMTNVDEFKTYYQDFFASSLPWNKLFKRELSPNLSTKPCTLQKMKYSICPILKMLKKWLI